MTRQATAFQLETLQYKLGVYQTAAMMADCAPSRVTAKAQTHALSALEDAAVECGMSRDEASAHQEALRITMLGYEADVIRVRANWLYAVVFPLEVVYLA